MRILFKKKTDRKTAQNHLMEAIKCLRDVTDLPDEITGAMVNSLKVIILLLEDELQGKEIWRLTKELQDYAKSMGGLAEWAKIKAQKYMEKIKTEIAAQEHQLQIKKNMLWEE